MTNQPWFVSNPDGTITPHWPAVLQPTWEVSHELLVDMIDRHNAFTAALNAVVGAA